VAADARPMAGHLPDRFAGLRPEMRMASPIPELGSSESSSAAGGVATLAPPAPVPPIEQPAQSVAPPRAWAHLEHIDGAPHAERTEHPVETPWHEPPAPAVEPESHTPQPLHDNGGGARPSLPRRRRQASLAPELAHDTQLEVEAQQPQQSAEQARDLMSAIAYGTQQARHSEPPIGHATRDEMEGEGR
ncbi:sensor histidine kinase, partial [Rhodococcus sp. NPDC055112]